MVHRLVGLAAALVAVAGLTSACTPEPAVSVSPDTGLVDGQQVTVIGTGYGNRGTVGVVQCRADAVAIDECDGRTASTLSTDDRGVFVHEMAVLAVVRDAHGVVTDCRSEPGACVVISSWVHGFQGMATAPLTFAPT